MKARKRPKPTRGKALGILNPYGDLWTYETFATETRARQYIADFWRGNPNAPALDKFKVVPVRVTVSVLPLPHQHREGGRG
jgi:hypothetical protein